MKKKIYQKKNLFNVNLESFTWNLQIFILNMLTNHENLACKLGNELERLGKQLS